MVCMLLAMTTVASPFNKQEGEVNPIPITRGTTEDGHDGPPRMPVQTFFSAYLDLDLNVLFVSAGDDVGEVGIVIENLTTGEYIEEGFDSSVTAYFPICGNAGLWQITLTPESGENYYGVFVL